MCKNSRQEDTFRHGIISYVKKNIFLLTSLYIFLCILLLANYIYSSPGKKIRKDFDSIYQINAAGENELIIIDYNRNIEYLNTLTNESKTLIPKEGESEKTVPYFCWTSKDHLICGFHQIIIVDRRQHPFSIKKISTDHIDKREDWHFFYIPSNKLAVIFEKSLSGEGIGRVFYADLKKEMEGKNNEPLYFEQLTENSVSENKITKNNYDDLLFIKNKSIYSKINYFLPEKNTLVLKNGVLEIIDTKRKESFFLPDEITWNGEKIKTEELESIDYESLSRFCLGRKNTLIVPMQTHDEEREFITIWDTEKRKEFLTLDMTMKSKNYLNKGSFLEIIVSDSGRYMAVLFWRLKKMGILNFLKWEEAAFDVWDVEKRKIVKTCAVPTKNPAVTGFTWGKSDDTIIVWGENRNKKGEVYIYNWKES